MRLRKKPSRYTDKINTNIRLEKRIKELLQNEAETSSIPMSEIINDILNKRYRAVIEEKPKQFYFVVPVERLKRFDLHIDSLEGGGILELIENQAEEENIFNPGEEEWGGYRNQRESEIKEELISNGIYLNADGVPKFLYC